MLELSPFYALTTEKQMLFNYAKTLLLKSPMINIENASKNTMGVKAPWTNHLFCVFSRPIFFFSVVTNYANTLHIADGTELFDLENSSSVEKKQSVQTDRYF